MAESKQKLIVITGATGNIGLETIKYLNERYPNLAVRTIVHGNDAKAEEKFRGLHVEKFLVPEGMKEDPNHYKGATALFVIPPPVENRAALVKEILNAAKQANVRFVLTPAHLSMRQNESVFATSFRQIEDDIKRIGIPHCFLHSEIFMDLMLMDAEDIKTKGCFSCYLDADARFNPIAAKDIGHVAAEILLSPEEHEDTRYTLTGPGSLSMTEVADTLSKLLKKDVKYKHIPRQQAVQAYLKQGVSEWFANGMVELEDIISKGESNYTSGDVAKLVGKDPMKISEFLQEHQKCFV